MNRLTRRLHGREDGFTLVELLVSMILLGIVGGIVATAASQALRTTASSEVSVSRTQDAQTAMDRMTRSIRAAYDPLFTPGTSTADAVYTPGVTASGPFKITYYTNVKNSSAGTCVATNPTSYIPEQVTDQVVADPAHPGSYSLTETVIQGACTGSLSPIYTWQGAGSVSTLAYGVADPTNATTPALFTYDEPTYYDQGLTADVARGTANCAASTPPTPVLATSGATTSLWVGAKPGTSVATTVSNVVITLTLSGTGVNVPQYVNTAGARTVSTSTTVTIDPANDYTSRDGTCL